MAESRAGRWWAALVEAARSGTLLLMLLLAAPLAVAGGVNLAWDPVSDPAVAGYKIYYGPSPGNYPSQVDVGNTTSYAVSGLTEGATYHFAVTAYDASRTESGYSNDASATVAYSTPAAQFTGTPTSGAYPLTVNFTSNSTGTITSYAWTFGDGGTSTAANPSHVYSTAGTYTVALTVTGPGGSDTLTRSGYVTVADAAPAAQFAGTPTTGTLPLTVNFTSNSTGTITSYAWTFGDGGTSTAANPSHVYSTAGTYTVALTVTGPGGSNTLTRSGYVTVSAAAPAAQFTGTPTTGTSPLTVNFTSTSTGTITGYAWTFGDGGTSTAANPSHVYSTAGTYTVALTVTGPGGSNTLTRSGYVTVSAAAPVAQFTATPTKGKAPVSINFTNNSTGAITSYAWTFGDGGTSTAASPGHLYAASGSYTVSLTVTGPGGSNKKTQTNYIKVTPASKFKGTPTAGPAPLAVNFTDESIGPVTSYAWDFGDGTASTAANPAKVYTAAGTYTVTLTVTGPGGTDTATSANYVTVSAPPPDTALYRALNAATGAPFYKFLLDTNFDHVPDAKVPFGMAGDVPLAGSINPGGGSSLIVYRNGTWFVDNSRDGTADAVLGFGGAPGDIPLVANFSGPGALDDLVVYRGGAWFVDRDLDGKADLTFGLGGAPGDVPLAGDVDGDGIADLVIYRNGTWYIDTNRDGTPDLVVNFGGMPQDVPRLFDWDGDGKADLCIYRDGVWYVSTKRDGTAQVIFGFGTTGDIPLTGRFH